MCIYYMYIYIYIYVSLSLYIYIYMYTHVYVYIHRERAREICCIQLVVPCVLMCTVYNTDVATPATPHCTPFA